MKTKFFKFNQNNSGGYFDVDENVCHRVIIEAVDEEQAIARFAPMIEDQSPSCSCCGDRWSLDYPEEIDLDEYKERGHEASVYSFYDNPEERWNTLYGEFPLVEHPEWTEEYGSKKFSGRVYFESIEQYCQFLANNWGWTCPDIRIHFMDGTKKEIFTPEDE